MQKINEFVNSGKQISLCASLIRHLGKVSVLSGVSIWEFHHTTISRVLGSDIEVNERGQCDNVVTQIRSKQAVETVLHSIALMFCLILFNVVFIVLDWGML